MNTKKLTLLIALSILLTIMAIVFSTSACEIPEAQGVVATTITTTTTTIIPTTTTTITTTVPTTTTTTITPRSTAQQIWDAMKNKGWSDEVCAGIMGNIMAECGGGTFDIQPCLHGDGKTSYGICQWHNERKSEMLSFNGTNYDTSNNLPPIEHQVDFFEYELEKYNIDILEGKDYQEVAYIFCVEFEIPNNKYKKAERRKQLAAIAYQEFAI